MLLFDAVGLQGGALPRTLQDKLTHAAYHYAKPVSYTHLTLPTKA